MESCSNTKNGLGKGREQRKILKFFSLFKIYYNAIYMVIYRKGMGEKKFLKMQHLIKRTKNSTMYLEIKEDG